MFAHQPEMLDFARHVIKDPGLRSDFLANLEIDLGRYRGGFRLCLYTFPPSANKLVEAGNTNPQMLSCRSSCLLIIQFTHRREPFDLSLAVKRVRGYRPRIYRSTHSA